MKTFNITAQVYKSDDSSKQTILINREVNDISAKEEAAHSILNMENIGSFVVVNENDIIEENKEEDIYFSINSLKNNNEMKLVY